MQQEQERHPYACSNCKRPFSSLEGLTYHENHFSGKCANFARPDCPICGKTFMSQWYMKDHKQRVHSNERNFQCTKCDYAARSQGQLMNHMETHEEDRRLVECPSCRKKFSTRRTLLFHRKEAHPKEPTVASREGSTYVCDVCNKIYEVSKSLISHIQYRHPERRIHLCPYLRCEHVATSEVQIASHQLEQHGGSLLFDSHFPSEQNAQQSFQIAPPDWNKNNQPYRIVGNGGNGYRNINGNKNCESQSIWENRGNSNVLEDSYYPGNKNTSRVSWPNNGKWSSQENWRSYNFSDTQGDLSNQVHWSPDETLNADGNLTTEGNISTSEIESATGNNAYECTNTQENLDTHENGSLYINWNTQQDWNNYGDFGNQESGSTQPDWSTHETWSTQQDWSSYDTWSTQQDWSTYQNSYPYGNANLHGDLNTQTNLSYTNSTTYENLTNQEIWNQHDNGTTCGDTNANEVWSIQ